MPWIKSHLTVVIVGAISAVALAMIVLGFLLSDASAAMQKDAALLGNLDRLQQDPANRDMIDAEEKYKDSEADEMKKFLASSKRVGEPLFTIPASLEADLGKEAPSEALHDAFAEAKQPLPPEAVILPEASGQEWLIGFGTQWYRVIKQPDNLSVHPGRGPLHPGVFPGDAGVDVYAAFAFQKLYGQAMIDLRAKLKARDAPSEEEFREYDRYLEERRKRADADRAMVRDGPGRKALAPEELPADGPLAGKRPEEEARSQARLQRSMLRAQETYCYATLDSLDRRPEITDSDKPPAVEDMWYAQVALWVQQDVIGALAKLNEAAAQERPEKDRWVGYLPVKHLYQVRLYDYVAGAAADASGSPAAPGSPGAKSFVKPSSSAADSAFTRRGSSGNVDVIHFELDLVVEATQLLRVIDAISRVGFYTPLDVSFWPEPPLSAIQSSGQRSAEDKYVYGPAPVVRVTLLYEACFLRDSYDQWMPQAVKTAIAAGQARGASSGSSGRPSGGSYSPRPAARPAWAPGDEFGPSHSGS